MNWLKSTCLIISVLAFSIKSYAQPPVGGDVVGKNIYGLAIDFQGDPIMVNDTPLIYKTSQSEYKNKSHLMSVFSSDVGGFYVSEFDKSGLKLVDTYPVDLSGVGGVAKPEGFVLTPWSSLLVNEAVNVDARNDGLFKQKYSVYYKGKSKPINAYNYGYVLEMVLPASESKAKLIKNYAIGRLSPSSISLMPDNKTLYVHDKDSGSLYVFVSEVENSFSKGALYVVSKELNQYKLINLGSSSALKVKFKLKKAQFSKIFSTKSGLCDGSGYQAISTHLGEECLKLNKSYKKTAGFFEPVRVAAMKGAQNFSKNITKITYQANSNTLHLHRKNKVEMSLQLARDDSFSSNYIVAGEL